LDVGLLLIPVWSLNPVWAMTYPGEGWAAIDASTGATTNAA
jgi:hypothetical protein